MTQNQTEQEEETVVGLGQPDVEWDGNIIDVVVPDELKHSYRTGHTFFDLLFAGDGILPSTSGLITGVPGSGKTTAMLQLADAITSSGGVCLYNTGEESLYQVRRVLSRIDLRHGFVPGYDTEVEAIINHANRLQEKTNKPIVVIQDSLQTINPTNNGTRRGRPPSKQNAEVKAVAQLTKWAKDTYNIILTIGQVNKRGDFSGKQAIKHIIDCHLHLDKDKDRRSDTYGSRMCHMTKNRFGTAGLFYTYELDAQGFHFNQPDIWGDD